MVVLSRKLDLVLLSVPFPTILETKQGIERKEITKNATESHFTSMR